ncbi:MAG: NrfD/PsrC family molybdoenzyme membrane anchor subunit [Candidatus Krumholzibacteriota bacterium]
MIPVIADLAATAAGYVFPNDLQVHWSLMIVLYPYITGIVAGAFIVSSMYHVFRVENLKPLAGFSLLFALAFLTCATVPLLVHLGQPGRAMSMFLTPNPTSAMAGFGYFYMAYGLLLVLEIFFIYRPTLVARHQSSTGIKRLFYLALSMGSDNLSAEALRMDRKIIKFLAVIGIPMACALHGYVGFIFGGVKANPLWATPLMPVIFLLSACVSGIAGIIIAYVILMKISRREIDRGCMRTSVKFLAGFFVLNFTFEMLEVFTHGYMATSHWETLHSLLWGPLYNSYWIWQVLVLSVIPLLLMGILHLAKKRYSLVNVLAPVSALMVLLQVLFMRWNVVIGGQLMSKSGRGSVFYQPEWLEREGILLAVVIMVIPIFVLYLLGKIFPFWQDDHPSTIRGIVP